MRCRQWNPGQGSQLQQLLVIEEALLTPIIVSGLLKSLLNAHVNVPLALSPDVPSLPALTKHKRQSFVKVDINIAVYLVSLVS